MPCMICIPKRDKLRYKEIFDKIDVCKTGSIRYNTLSETIKNLYKNKSQSFDDMFTENQRKKNVQFNFREFVILMHTLEKSLGHQAQLSLFGDEEDFFSTFSSFSFTPRQESTETIYISWWKLLVAGGFAGLVSTTLLAPFDRITVLYQVGGAGVSRLPVSKAFVLVKRREGWRSLWKGNGLNLLKMVPDSGIRYLTYEELKEEMRLFSEDWSKRLTTSQKIFALTAATTTAETILYPLSVLKTKIMVAPPNFYSGIFDCALKITKTEGLRAFYRGYFASVVRITPYAGLDHFTYEFMKTVYMYVRPELDEPSLYAVMTCSVISSALTQALVYPITLVRTNLQAGNNKSTKTYNYVENLWRNEGLAGFYKGLNLTLMKVIPAVGISFFLYERSKLFLGLF